MNSSKSPAPRESQEGRTVLARILDTPHLERVVPRLQPELLHRVIQSCGLEDCGELVAMATPEQLMRIFDLDLWRPAQAGMDDQFDADRFGVWLEVLVEFDADMAAKKLAQMDTRLVIAGLAQHARVFDCATVTPYRTTDGLELPGIRGLDSELGIEIGGYLLVAKRTDSWEAIVTVLLSLDAECPDYFHQVMRGCRALSNGGRELDELDDLLAVEHQAMFDQSLEREQRRDDQGYVTPAQACAFLEMSRQLQLGSAVAPPASPIALAYFRSLEKTTTAYSAPANSSPSTTQSPSADPSEATAALFDVLLDAGIIAQPPRALLDGPKNQTMRLQHIRARMEFVFNCNNGFYSRRNDELTYLANTIMAGCALQGRAFTTQEAWDAAVAVCNLGLQNWPPLWSVAQSLPDDFLVNHDLVTVFQVGWTVLHKDVSMYSAKQLLEVLATMRSIDRDIETGLSALRVELTKGCRAGMPWRARDALEAIAILDLRAWTALLGLIQECPVLHAVISASRNPRTLSVSASDFEFISENSQIAAIREFIQSLPEALRP